eukprot:gene1973-2109_t
MKDNQETTVSERKYLFGEQGQYNIIANDDYSTIEIDEFVTPINSLLPLEILIGILAFIAIASFGGPILYEKYKYSTRYRNNKNPEDSYNTLSVNIETDGEVSGENAERLLPTSNNNDGIKKKPKRLQSLDTFRGISLLLMIFVNYGGGGYWFFEHAAWHGLTLADLVFPWFMWIMGVSMALSFSNILPRKPSKTISMFSTDDEKDYLEEKRSYNRKYYRVWKKVTIRAIKLFLLGMFLANGYEYTTWRVPGVLQYFAVSYFVTAATILLVYPWTQRLLDDIKLKEKTSYGDLEHQESIHEIFDIDRLKESINYHQWSFILTSYRYEWIIQVLIIIVYLAVHLGAAAPDCPAGYQGPGGISDNSAHPFCTGGIHRYIDMKTFGYDFIYHHATCRDLYQCRAYDPEGLLGVLSACTLTYIGLMVGRIFLHYKNHQDRLLIINSWSFFILLLAGILCGFSQNEGIIPVNKNMWTTSFILVTAGFGIIGLSICYIIIDVYQVWTGAPFIYLGLNSILFYMAHQLLQEYMPFSYEIYHVNHGSLLLCHCIGVLSWVIIAYYCYTIKFFVKV